MIDRHRQGFSHFLQQRRALRHFSRRPLVAALAARGPATAAPVEMAARLQGLAQGDAGTVLARLDARADGLSDEQAAARRASQGPNEVAHEPPLPAWQHLWQCYRNPFNLLLTALAALSWINHDGKATTVIGAMVVLSTGIRFVQEGRAHRAAEGLRALVGNTATVLRPAPAGEPGSPAAAPQRLEIPMRDLVAGDVIALSAGDMVPADARLLTARGLYVAQSALTGESLAIEKAAEPGLAQAAPLEQRNLVFMGTSVMSGAATALVVATGSRSYFGSVALHATTTATEPNAFQAGVNSVSWLLIRFALVMVPVVLLVNGFTKGNWPEAFLFALSVAVGLTPEMLPMIVTSTLARGAVALAKRQVVVKRLDAIQNLGAMDVLCTDKTGTLTQDQVALARHSDPLGAPSEEALAYAFLNSHHQTGLKNLLDRAVIAHADPARALALTQGYAKLDEIPFDFERRRMSVVVSQQTAGGARAADAPRLLVCKGAVEEVLAACTRVRLPAGEPAGAAASAPGTDRAADPLSTGDTRDVPLDAALRERVRRVTQQLNDEGLRVVAVAAKTLPARAAPCGIADESDLTLVGTIGFLDPPKESAAPALRALAAHGIRVVVLTGDNEAVSARVCREVGLPADTALLGAQVEAMDDAALAAAVEDHRLFAKLAPLHKERIVQALRARGHVVGFLGDGINDAAALHAADIGISVHSAVDIAKEAADIILLEKSLLVLDEGVIEGRTTFCNMLKYIRMTASSNFGNVLSVLVASAVLPFLPMLPLQLLTQNLLYDVAQTGIPFDRVDAEQVSQPLQWHPQGIGRFMLWFGPVSSLFDLATFALMWWVFKADTVAEQGLFQSGWFVVGLLTQTLVVHLIRTARLPFIESRAAWPLMASTLAIMAVAVWLPMGPLAADFRLQPLPPAYFGWLLAILLGYAALTTFVKRLYIGRCGWP